MDTPKVTIKLRDLEAFQLLLSRADHKTRKEVVKLLEKEDKKD
ncbi:hypothetical protein [Thalassobacillus sp. C254]|nr:hypothetical protein [Thalassobacillus sp. C254]